MSWGHPKGGVGLDEDGGSTVSGPDFAAAIVEEIEEPRHHRAHIGVIG